MSRIQVLITFALFLAVFLVPPCHPGPNLLEIHVDAIDHHLANSAPVAVPFVPLDGPFGDKGVGASVHGLSVIKVLPFSMQRY